jgi:rhodanese-related sulfurtransferase
MKKCQNISSAQFKLLKAQDVVIIDVRSKMEHEEKRLVKNHFHIPLDQLDPEKFLAEQKLDGQKTIYFLCRGGARARRAAEKFLSSGHENVCVVEGGLTACESWGEGLEGYALNVCSATKSCHIPLERQVRIAAGSIVLIGSILALSTDILFALIPLFVGAGLIFAGITDRCGMALILTKAPWNRSN